MGDIVVKTRGLACPALDQKVGSYNGPMRISWMLALVAAQAMLAACSPDQNWRQVTLDGTQLKAQLPCKPDRATREVPLGGVPVQLSVVGCASGDAMLAVMSAALAPAADAQAVLQGWQQATLANLQVSKPDQIEAWLRPGLLPLGAAQRLVAQGRKADGQPVTVQAAWGAYPEGDHLRLVHAVVYAPKAQSALAQMLFDGVQP